MDYQRYSSQFKEAILNKLSQSGLSVRKFAVQEGINISTLYSWQKQFNTSGLSVAKVTPEQKSDKKRIKELERELRRKDKALAETAALLVLGKKFDAYWKDKEDS